VILFDAAERECGPYGSQREGHPDHHPGRGRARFQHSTLRHQPNIDAEIDAEQSERSDGGCGTTYRDREARLLAAVHEREAECRETQGRHGFRASEAETQLDSNGSPAHQPINAATAIASAAKPAASLARCFFILPA
jgi:hypothetical protein